MQVLTEKSKSDLQERYHSSKLQIQKEQEQLQFQYEKTRENKKIPTRRIKIVILIKKFKVEFKR